MPAPVVVRDLFIGFSIPKEGRLARMYVDTKNLVTTGVGNLIDPAGLALGLPWLRADGTHANRQEILAEWQRVKSSACGDYRDALKCAWAGTGKVCFAHKGWTASTKGSPLHLSEEAIDALVYAKLDQMWDFMKRWLPDLESWPMDAALALCSMSWALGPAFYTRWPTFTAAAKRRDFLTCSNECRMQGQGTIVQRNAANKALFLNAACVEKAGLDAGVLYYPKDDAVRAFQLARGLSVDGIIGPKTLAALSQ